MLEVCLDEQVVEAALRIHPLAWWDGEHLKKSVATDEVSVGNTAPQLVTLTIGAENPAPGEDILCSGTAEDPDPDVLTYSVHWSNGDTTIQGSMAF